MGDFIRLYATRNKRWSTPKFLAGESYGTTRAAGLSGYLQQRYGMYLNGIILVSTILNFQTADFNTGNDLPYILYLPTYTAIAWYQKKLPADLQADLHKAVEESQNFAKGEYTTALIEGTRRGCGACGSGAEACATDDFPRIISRRTNMRVEIEALHLKELMLRNGATVGRIDGRFIWH